MSNSCNTMDCSPPGSSVHGISQTRILEWVAMSFFRGSSWPRDQTHVSSTDRWILHHWATREARHHLSTLLISFEFVIKSGLSFLILAICIFFIPDEWLKFYHFHRLQGTSFLFHWLYCLSVFYSSYFCPIFISLLLLILGWIFFFCMS